MQRVYQIAKIARIAIIAIIFRDNELCLLLLFNRFWWVISVIFMLFNYGNSGAYGNFGDS
jgi:hypothetical protein